MRNSEYASFNRIPEKVLVELICEELDFQKDAELPTNMPVSALRRGLLTLLQEKEPRRFSKQSEIIILFKGTQLEDKLTLADVGAWDGSILELIPCGDSPTYRKYF